MFGVIGRVGTQASVLCVVGILVVLFVAFFVVAARKGWMYSQENEHAKQALDWKSFMSCDFSQCQGEEIIP